MHKYIKHLQQRCKYWMEKNPIRLGGEGDVCEIYESLFRQKAKYHRGRTHLMKNLVSHQRIKVSILQKFIFNLLIFVQLRHCYELYKMLQRESSVALLTIRAYSNISIDFEDFTVNHKINFIDPNNLTNAQVIESIWNKNIIKIISEVVVNV